MDDINQHTRKTVLVGGGSGGIGSAICTEFARRGYAVSFTYRNSRAKAGALASQVGADVHALDLTDAEATARVVRRRVLHHRRVDCRGRRLPPVKRKRGTADAAIGQTRDRHRSGIRHGARGQPVALVGLAKSLALRFAPEGIRVNARCPGPIDSPMLRYLIAGRNSVPNGAELGAKLLASIPMGRFGAPHEVAEAALWLAFDAASFVTGIALPVDGGVTAR